MTSQFLGYAVFTSLMVAAIVTDIRSLTVPPILTLAVVILFIPYAISQNYSSTTWVDHVLCGLALFVGGFICAWMDWIGGGDVKLLGGVGLWLGLGPGLLDFAVGVALVSLPFCGVLWLLRTIPVPWPAFVLEIPWVHEAVTGTGPLRKLKGPFAVPIAAAAAVAIWAH